MRQGGHVFWLISERLQVMPRRLVLLPQGKVSLALVAGGAEFGSVVSLGPVPLTELGQAAERMAAAVGVDLIPDLIEHLAQKRVRLKRTLVGDGLLKPVQPGASARHQLGDLAALHLHLEETPDEVRVLLDQGQNVFPAEDGHGKDAFLHVGLRETASVRLQFRVFGGCRRHNQMLQGGSNALALSTSA